MATITETEVPEVEVTSIAATKDTDLNKEPSKFSKLRRRFKLGNADGTKRPSGVFVVHAKLLMLAACLNASY